MEQLYPNSETGCCPRFDPKPWDQTEVELRERLFLKDRVRCLFHIPLDFGRMMVRNMKKIQDAGALLPEPLMLCDENSLWGADVYIGVSREVPGAETVRISGTFLTKVFEGPYRHMGGWIEEMKSYVSAEGRALKKLYFFYTTCPKCARVYGRNYTVVLAEV